MRGAEAEEARGLLADELLERVLAASLQSREKSAGVAQLLQEDTHALRKTRARHDSVQAALDGAALSLRGLERGYARRKALLLGGIALLFALDAALIYLKLAN